MQSSSQTDARTVCIEDLSEIPIYALSSRSNTVRVGAGHDDDLVEREAHSLAAQISRLADVLTVREFNRLRLKLDGIFDDFLLGNPDQ